MNVFFLSENKKTKVIGLPKFNYCDLRRGMFGILSVYKEFLETYYKYGNLSAMCPFKKGYYYMQNVLLDDSQLPTFILTAGSGTYVVQSIVTDESVKPKIWLCTNEFFVVFAGRKN
jgi:hypothetical protein